MTEQAKSRPNILYIFTDQQVADAMSCAGNAHIRTPGIDSIATSGVRFDSAYAAFPLCTPNRASMFTGKMPSELGVARNHVPLPEAARQEEMGWLFRHAGYETAYSGKWHLPGQSMEEGHGFTIISGMDDEGAARASVEFLKQPHENPFLLVMAFWQPHGCCPFHRFPDVRECRKLGLSDYGLTSLTDDDHDFDWPADAYEPSFLERCPPLPDNFAPSEPEPELITKTRNKHRDMPPDQRPSFWQPQERFNAVKDWPDEMFRYYRWAYYRLVEYVDSRVMQILDALREGGHADNTLVVFSSDHGDMLGAHRLVAKNVFYEEAIRTPLLMSLPGHVKSGHVVESALVSNGLDLLPTFCDYAGIAPPPGLEGRSLRPLAEDRVPDDWWKDLVIEVSPGMGNGRLLHTGRYKYAAYDTGEHPEELYDLENDPGELKNLYEDPEYRQVRDECRRRIFSD